VEYLKPLFALLAFLDKPLQIVTHMYHRFTDGPWNLLVESLVVELSLGDLFCLFGDRSEVSFRLE